MGFSAQGLVDVYKKLGPEIIGVEIGVCRGENIKNLLNECQNIKKIYGIDPWIAYQDSLTITQETADGWHKNATDLLSNYLKIERAVLIRKKSLDAVDAFENGQLDFVFIDGNHSYDMALADCRAWWQKVKPGGVLSGHDFRPKDIEVRKAVYEFSSEINKKVIEPEVIKNFAGPCWYISKGT